MVRNQDCVHVVPPKITDITRLATEAKSAVQPTALSYDAVPPPPPDREMLTSQCTANALALKKASAAKIIVRIFMKAPFEDLESIIGVGESRKTLLRPPTAYCILS